MLVNEEGFTKDLFYYLKVMYILQLIIVKSSFSKPSNNFKKIKRLVRGKENEM